MSCCLKGRFARYAVPMDVLADVLAVSGVRGALGARIEAGEDWGWWAEPAHGAAFHAITSGTVWLGWPGHPPRELMPGDVVLLPGGADHVLASDADALARTGEHRSDGWERTDAGAVRIGSGAVRTHILCAQYVQDPVVTTQVLDLLPDLVHIRAQDGGDALQDTVRLLGHELAHPQLATAAVLGSLVDILLIQVLRVWLGSQPVPCAPSWLGVLADPVVGAAVAKLHEDPARAWTTALLARETAVSRATLSRRFPAVVGKTPGAYLTDWRMDLAARRLRDTDDTLESIAHSVGYTSVYAFSRAFSRARSQPPGRYRVAARAGSGSTAPEDESSPGQCAA
jgi:AraC-like DNA-binding protein